MKNKKVLILGGNGKTGRRVAERLSKKGINLRIGSRKGNPAFDWENTETWSFAIEGMNMVYITFQPDLAVPGATEKIEAFTTLARNMGVQKIVLLSGRGEKAAQLCEQIVLKSEIPSSIVRADWFNQNFSENFFLEPILAGHVVLPRVATPVAFVDAEDIADVVVESLLNDDNIGKIHELTGPRLWTFEQVIHEISKATNREIRFESVEIDQYIDMLRDLQLPEDSLWLVRYLFTEALDGKNASVTNDVEKALGRKAKELTEYIQETVVTGIWN